MGFNTTVIIRNDALHDIENDAEFGEKLAAAVSRVSLGEPVDISAGSSVNAATVIETHHADTHVLVSVGASYGRALPGSTFWKTSSDEDHLRALAAELGFTVSKKRKK